MNKREWMLATATAMVATGNNFDIEERTASLSAFYDAIVAASPEPADEGWIEHRGEKPYPEGMVEVRYRNGTEHTGDADEWVWSHGWIEDHDSEIIAWRPAT